MPRAAGAQSAILLHIGFILEPILVCGFLLTFVDSSTKSKKMRSPKGVKSGLLGRVPAGVQAPGPSLHF